MLHLSLRGHYMNDHHKFPLQQHKQHYCLYKMNVMKHAHIGHDCIIQNNVTISCGAKIGGHSIIKEKSNIGLNAVLHQFTTIEKGCMIGASAFIKGLTEEYSKYAGVPAKKIGINNPR